MLNEIWAPALAGALAGLGVAMPLGAIGVLLLREGLTNGFPTAASGAAGVALVDLVYCAFATVVGARVAAGLEGHRGAFMLVSGVLILGIGIRQLIAVRRTSVVDGEAVVERSSPLRAFTRFVALTAINPLTLVYFVALAGPVSTTGGSWVGPTVFVVAVGVSSLAWQLLLAGAGSAFGSSISANARRATGVVASALVITLGVGIVVGGVGALP